MYVLHMCLSNLLSLPTTVLWVLVSERPTSRPSGAPKEHALGGREHVRRGQSASHRGKCGLHGKYAVSTIGAM